MGSIIYDHPVECFIKGTGDLSIPSKESAYDEQMDFSHRSSEGFSAEDTVLIAVRNVWFQHDGAPVHKTSLIKKYPVEDFGEQVIGYGGFHECPERSPDITPMDFFLWEYLKQKVHATHPRTLQDLQRHITDPCANVTNAMLHLVKCEVKARVLLCIVSGGEV
ncbi:hypothetical protein AVEN_247236-1 [Araneus ventricosus]|uniref:Tc1-like transposase DDE domain-containing protein n=1 Tax=Araneus ventricosus TaxID=182803 RepID=A0A4Y2ET94_ARAVE|nr:hypothetical protein AVEN_247236-1 [Araneus ventricosus]